MAKTRSKGIFCLEGNWDSDLRTRESVGPLLELLEGSRSLPVRYIRRDIGTVGELEYYLGKWTQKRYEPFPILYLGFHGAPGLIEIGQGKDEQVELEWLQDRLTGACKRRIIHFGSCETLATGPGRLRQFLGQTEALAICGYRASVNWMLSAAFELILMYELQFNALTRAGMAAVQRRIKQKAGRLADQLEFQMVFSSK